MVNQMQSMVTQMQSIISQIQGVAATVPKYAYWIVVVVVCNKAEGTYHGGPKSTGGCYNSWFINFK